MIRNVKFLNEEHKASVAVEEMIMFPIMFMTFAILVYTAMMAFTYIYYNALANNIANDFNIGSTGFKTQAKYELPDINCSTIKYDGTSDGTKKLSDDNITTNVRESVSLPWDCYHKSYYYGYSHLYYVLDKYNQIRRSNNDPDIFEMPYSEIANINLDFDGAIFNRWDQSIKGTTVKITIEYKSMFFGAKYLPTIKATGYSIIM